MQSFYSESQRPSENVTSYGSRLEVLLQVAVERGNVSQSSKFRTGPYVEKLKLLTSHKYDTISDYNSFLREVKAADSEQEFSTSDRLTKVQCQSVSDTRDKMVEDLSKKMDTLMTEIQSLEKDIKDSKKQTSSLNSIFFWS
jgi:predicted  nucleic acid-binding Zn-ribbon protein